MNPGARTYIAVMGSAIRTCLLLLCLAVPTVARAVDSFQPIPAAEADLASLHWTAKPVVVFADAPEDPAFVEQMRLLSQQWPELAARGVVVIVDTRPADNTALRQSLRPRGFALVLLDAEGRVAMRKPFPWSARELGRAIDRMR